MLCFHAPTNLHRIYADMCEQEKEGVISYGENFAVALSRGECHIFEQNVGEVYWQNESGAAIIFPRPKAITSGNKSPIIQNNSGSITIK